MTWFKGLVIALLSAQLLATLFFGLVYWTSIDLLIDIRGSVQSAQWEVFKATHPLPKREGPITMDDAIPGWSDN